MPILLSLIVDAEEFSSDGGSQFISEEFKEFLKTWGVSQRLSSVDYPQSNGRAENSVKSSKRMIMSNARPNGSLDTDRFAKAILQYRNTPFPDLGLSPAQLLFHRQLRDSVPCNPKHYRLHRDWILSADQRERLYSKRNLQLESNYNQRARNLAPLGVGSNVRVQNKGKWDRTGLIVEALPNRQYRVKLNGSGRITLRNRRFLKLESLNTGDAVVNPNSGSSSGNPNLDSDSSAVPIVPNKSNQQVLCLPLSRGQVVHLQLAAYHLLVSL